MKVTDHPDDADITATIMRQAWVVLLLRGTGIACAGGIAVATLGVEHDPVWRWAAVPLGAGLVLLVAAFASMQRAERSSRIAVAIAVVVVLAWVFVVLTPLFKIDPFGLRKEPWALVNNDN